MRRIFSILPLAAVIVALATSTGWADHGTGSSAKPADLSAQVRHELVMLPFYGVYDDLNYAITGDTVTLTGQVTRPTLKSDAEAVVQRIPGISSVVNHIEVLPLSDWDNRVRREVYLTLFNSRSPLFRYGLGSDPSIHIIVENGHVTLKGAVSSQSDKQIASMYVSGLFGVFSVTNDLTVGRIG